MGVKKNWITGILTTCLLVALLPAAFAAELGEANITPQMKMKEIRENPSLTACGISTYGDGDADSEFMRAVFQNLTLEQYVGETQAEDCAKGLNMAIENYNKGVQVTWQLYSPEEIAADSSLGCAQMYYFPAEQPNARYALVIGGNVFFTSGELREGVASVAQLHEAGYAVFLLRHRIWLDLGDNAPLKDLGRALQLINSRAEEFGVQTENYALMGYSSGGHMIGLMASEKDYGYRSYGVPKPGVLMLAYSMNSLTAMKPVYNLLADTGSCDWHYYWSNVSDVIGEGYPPVYMWYGLNDLTLRLSSFDRQGPTIDRTLTKYGVPHKTVVYTNAPHAIGTGCGTDAEGWVKDAVAFWEEQCG